MKKRLCASAASVFLLISLAANALGADGSTTLTAFPASQVIKYSSYTEFYNLNVPIYAIIQPGEVNGNNYLGLRDIASVIDFAVEWNASEPDAMRIYTNRHYDGTQVSSGAATTSKVAVPSNMRIYVDDKLIDASEFKAYMIENKNYFKLRDIAQIVNFGCTYYANENEVWIMPNRYYVPDDGPNRTLREIHYKGDPQIERIYGTPSGEFVDAPHTPSILDPMAREDYWNTYASEEAKAAFNRELAKTNRYCYDIDEVNAYIQTLIDLPELRKMGCYDDSTFADNSFGYVPAHYLNEVGRGAERWGGSPIPSYTDTAPRLRMIQGLGTNPPSIGYYDGRFTEEQVQLAQVPAVAEILAKLPGKSSREQVKIIVRAVCDKVEYAYNVDDEPRADYFSYGIDMWRDDRIYYGVCSHYERITRDLCDLAGIPCFETGGGEHAWNEVYLADEDMWVAVDSTWADGNWNGYFEKYAITDPIEHRSEVYGYSPEDIVEGDYIIVKREIIELGIKLRNQVD